MKWIYEQQEDVNREDYMSYLITKSLKGKMTPTREGVVRLINSKRKVRYENRKI